MTRCTRLLAGLSAAVLVLTGALAGRSAFAQPKPASPPPAAPPLTEDQAKAQEHFKAAKDLYAAGSYREAVAELEAARALDPKAKDLVFNLGIVHEKLQKFDEAIAYFRTYLEMEGVTTQEKQKAESIIKRIEGAKREVVTPPPSGTTGGAGTGGGETHAPNPRGDGGGEQPEHAQHGRIDAATIAVASVAVVGLGVGTGFGIYALTTRPNDFVTGRDGTYQDLKDKTDQAHTAALVSDVGFGVGIVATAVTAWLYFGRTKEQPKRTGVTATPTMLPGGGAILVGGTFR